MIYYEEREDTLRVDIDTLNASIEFLKDKLAGLKGIWQPPVSGIIR